MRTRHRVAQERKTKTPLEPVATGSTRAHITVVRPLLMLRDSTSSGKHFGRSRLRADHLHRPLLARGGAGREPRQTVLHASTRRAGVATRTLVPATTRRRDRSPAARW